MSSDHASINRASIVSRRTAGQGGLDQTVPSDLGHRSRKTWIRRIARRRIDVDTDVSCFALPATFDDEPPSNTDEYQSCQTYWSDMNSVSMFRRA